MFILFRDFSGCDFQTTQSYLTLHMDGGEVKYTAVQFIRIKG